MVVSKQSGLLSVPGRGAALADCLEARVRSQYPGGNESFTGSILIPRASWCWRAIEKPIGTWARQFEKRQVRKVYMRGSGVSFAMMPERSTRP